jgi:hypothetical protein
LTLTSRMLPLVALNWSASDPLSSFPSESGTAAASDKPENVPRFFNVEKSTAQNTNATMIPRIRRSRVVCNIGFCGSTNK